MNVDIFLKKHSRVRLSGYFSETVFSVAGREDFLPFNHAVSYCSRRTKTQSIMNDE